MAGENIVDAIIREVQEEIGLKIKKEEIKLIIEAKHSSYRGDNNTFRYEFFYRTNKKIEDFILQKEEVSKVKYITIEEAEELINKKDEEYLFTRWEYIKDVIKYLKENI